MKKLDQYDEFVHALMSKMDIQSEHYKKYILKLKKYPDGEFYEGYLWDCIIDPKRMSEEDLDAFLRNKEELFVFWDNHSDYRVNIRGYFKRGKRIVYKLSGKEFLKKKDSFPEDVYITDNDKSFWAVYTHEWFAWTGETEEVRYCFTVGK